MWEDAARKARKEPVRTDILGALTTPDQEYIISI